MLAFQMKLINRHQSNFKLKTNTDKVKISSRLGTKCTAT